MSAQPIQSLRIERRPRARIDSRPAPPEDRANQIGLDFMRAMLHSPAYTEQIADSTTLILITLADPDVARLNLSAVRPARARGEEVQFFAVDERGQPVGGTQYTFRVDLRDEGWGARVHPTLGDHTAAEARAILRQIATASQDDGPVAFAYENIVVLNGARVYIVDEPEPGIFECLAIEVDRRR